jgi:exopolyphosphatase/pppGpp-phosphohydrolase
MYALELQRAKYDELSLRQRRTFLILLLGGEGREKFLLQVETGYWVKSPSRPSPDVPDELSQTSIQQKRHQTQTVDIIQQVAEFRKTMLEEEKREGLLSAIIVGLFIHF